MQIELTVKNKRIAYGFERTESNATEDIVNCKCMPGMLNNEDLTRMFAALRKTDESIEQWALRSLLASDGSLIMNSMTGQTKRIPTLVPRRNTITGYCQYLKSDRCTIHADAPFGCAFFDMRMREAEGHQRSCAYHHAMERLWDQDNGGVYGIIWRMLQGAGHTAKNPAECRDDIQAMLMRKKPKRKYKKRKNRK